jgi:hypothetical protein
MKNIAPFSLLVLFVLSANLILAQDSTIKPHSISAGLGLIGSSASNTETGFNYVLDFTMSFSENLGSIYLNQGAELSLFNAKQDYLEISALYGREYKLNSTISLEGHAGIGYIRNQFKNNDTDFEEVTESTIGFPVRMKLLFAVSPALGLGINPNFNFNSFANVSSVNTVLQYRFN